MHTSTGVAASGARSKNRRPPRRLKERLSLSMRGVAEPLGLAAALFFMPFVSWFGVPSPFAAAFLLGLARKPAPILALSLAASLGLRLLWGLEADLWQYAGVFGLWLVLRAARPRQGVETAALAGLAMMPRALATLAAGDPHQTLLAISAVPMAMLSAVCLRCGMDAVREMGVPAGLRERLCLALAGLLLVSALGHFRIGAVNLGQAGAVLLTLAYAGANGPVYGVTGGLMAGLSLALEGQDCRVALALGMVGFACGLAGDGRRRWLCVPGALAAAALALFVTPLPQPPLGYGAGAVGAVCYALLPSQAVERLRAWLHGTTPPLDGMETTFLTQRIAHMQQALRDVAQALPGEGAQTPSAGAELGELLCAQCANRETCWGRSRARTERMLGALMDVSRRGGTVDETTVPALAQHGCLRAEAADETAREALALRIRREQTARKARFERELTVAHLSAMCGALGELGVMAAGENLNDLSAAHTISSALEALHVPARLRYARRVDGHLQVSLDNEGVLPLQKPLESLLTHLAQDEAMPLSVSRAERGRVELEEVPLYAASVGMAMVSAGDGGGTCGDACSAKRCEGGRLLMMLCDGMGHGQAAHDQSEKTLELLMLLLQAGYTRRQAITAVNGIMLTSQQDDRFSTVDLADVDLWTGDVYLEKLGACASWVVRGNHMKKVEGASLPIGVTEEALPTGAQCRLHSGDILVMMSDGVSDVFCTDDLMRRALEESVFIQPQRMADALLRSALVRGGGSPRDDMTVLVLLLVDRQHAA